MCVLEVGRGGDDVKKSYFEDSEDVERAKNSDPGRDSDLFSHRLRSWVMCYTSPNEPRRSTLRGRAGSIFRHTHMWG